MELLKLYALQFVGLPYRWGGDDTLEGFDCSGFVQELLACVGADPKGDQTAQGLYEYFKTKSTLHQKGLGALVFYGQSLGKITHVSMMLDSFRIIEAGGGNSQTVNAAVAAKQNAYIRVRHLNHRKDILCILMPTYALISEDNVRGTVG